MSDLLLACIATCASVGHRLACSARHAVHDPRRGRPGRGGRARGEAGQTTAEYALVILGAAAIAGLLITWATNTGAVERLFDAVIRRLTRQVG